MKSYNHYFSNAFDMMLNILKVTTIFSMSLSTNHPIWSVFRWLGIPLLHFLDDTPIYITIAGRSNFIMNVRLFNCLKNNSETWQKMKYFNTFVWNFKFTAITAVLSLLLKTGLVLTPRWMQWWLEGCMSPLDNYYSMRNARISSGNGINGGVNIGPDSGISSREIGKVFPHPGMT